MSSKEDTQRGESVIQGRQKRPGVSGVSRRTFLATGATGVVASLVGCLGNSESSSSLPSATYRHRYQRSGLDAAPNDAGVELGLWEEEGIDVEFTTSNGSQAAVQSIAQGQDKFGNAEISAVLRQIQEGSSLRIIGQVIDPMAGVVSTAEAGIESWTDMEGKVIGQYPFGATGPLAMAALEKRGGDPSNVETRNMQPGSEEALMMEGEIDAAVTYFPQAVARLEQNGYETNVLIITNVLENLGVSLFTRQEVIDDETELVNSFVRGWLRAHKMFATDLDAVIEAYRDKVPNFDEELVMTTVGPIYASRVPTRELGTSRGKGWTPADQLETTQSVLRDAGLLEESRDVEEYYTNEYIEDNQELAIETAEAFYEALDADYDVGPDYV